MKTVSKKLLSILLVAILLVSTIPFQAFATEGEGATEASSEAVTVISNEAATTAAATTVAHDPSLPNHTPEGWVYDATNHWQTCPVANCEYHNQIPASVTAHSYDSNGVCTVCGYTCPHTNTVAKDAVAADCVHAGKAADTYCTDCGAKLATGTTIAATGVHTYDNGTYGTCTVCGATKAGASHTLTLNANGGTINGGATLGVNVQEGSPISVLPDPTREGYTFAGWFINGVQISLGSTYNYTGDQTAVAKWTEITYNLTVRRVLNGDNSTAQTLLSVNVSAGTPLLNYLNNNVTSTIQSALAVTPGYTWEYNFWKDYSGTQSLTSQDQMMNQAQTVYVNFVSKSYTLYFNANGGTVTPTSKTVYYGSAVGTLPTASLSGKVFQGWKDSNGTIYSASTVYQIAGDSSLTAVWADEASVMLYVYINGDFSGPNRLIALDGFVKNNNVSRSDVYAQVAKYYTPASGTLSIAGLFDDYTWSSYRANTSKAGTENIQVSDTSKIYVMVNNASTGTTVVTGTTTTTNGSGTTTLSNGTTVTTTPVGSYWVSTGSNGAGYWVYPVNGSTTATTSNGTYIVYTYTGSNPKTGDTAQIEVAAAIMVLAAAALVTMVAIHKKKA